MSKGHNLWTLSHLRIVAFGINNANLIAFLDELFRKKSGDPGLTRPRVTADALRPELGLTAYSCEDLFHQQELLQGARHALSSVLKTSENLSPVVAVGAAAGRGKLPIEKMYVSDSIPMHAQLPIPIQVSSLVALLAETIQRLDKNPSIAGFVDRQ